jgi:predicted ribosome quality control (RQC) complex YloA/Tae2 family protein
MSLNWKEINLTLEELDLGGAQIQKAVQSAFDVLSLKLYGKGGAKTLLVSISPLACRIHETFDSVPKSARPLRFAEFLNSKIINGRIEEAVQLGNDRIVRITVRCNSEEGEARFFIYFTARGGKEKSSKPHICHGAGSRPDIARMSGSGKNNDYVVKRHVLKPVSRSTKPRWNL